MLDRGSTPRPLVFVFGPVKISLTVITIFLCNFSKLSKLANIV